jgi:hypothetical protein
MTAEPAGALPRLPSIAVAPTSSGRDELRAQVLDHLRSQGFQVANDRLIAPVTTDKDKLRSLHAQAVAAQRAKSANTLRRHEDSFLLKLADGNNIDPASIKPALVPINDRRSFDGLLWRWCSLHWSIPVSSGYGRRLRFLVVDEGNGGQVMGLIGLADPVFALGVRDAWIGWNHVTRRERLANVMDAFVLGAVPPYNALRAGKLVALLATSKDVRSAFADRYGHRQTLISQRDPNAHLALVTTTSALGRSSVYNRLTGPDGALAFQSVGYTLGSGDFHLSGAIYEALAKFAAENNPEGKTHAHERWRSGGPRNRREVIQRALQALDLDPRRLRLHGIRREVFLAPLMANARDYLLEGTAPEWTDRPVGELADHWAHRWALPRAARDDTWRAFRPESWRIFAA